MQLSNLKACICLDPFHFTILDKAFDISQASQRQHASMYVAVVSGRFFLLY